MGSKLFHRTIGEKNTDNIYLFFSFLKERFNGDLFIVKKEELPNDNQLDSFCRFFRGEDFIKDGNSQLRFFPYDFSVIPIGLVSNIYETFFSIDDEWKNEKKAAGTGTFYTPYYLVDYMVQQSFSQFSKEDVIPCVLDPSCGSGIFLVNAFKKQIDILKNKNEVIDVEQLRIIMTDMIVGVDISLNALRISCFSLYIALLDELSPKDITENNFQFPNLIGLNLIEGSFFSAKIDQQLYHRKIDIIVGNPPWKSITKSDHILYCKERKIPIADAQIAQAFIGRTKDFTNERTEVSLLITNAIFTNKNSKKYLEYLLSEYRIERVINLEAVKAQLFEHAKYPCSILSYRCLKEIDYKFSYYAFRPNMVFRLLHQLVYDKSEELEISKQKIETREYLWTILTYGDEFDIECIETLKQFPTLSSSIEGKLDFVQGYITAVNGEKCPEFKGYKGGSLKGYFMPYGLNYSEIPEISPEILYDRTRKLSMYTCAHKVLIKRTYNEKCSGAAYIKEPLIFSNDFSTFNDYTGNNVGLLRYIEGILNSKVFWYYCFYMTKVKAAKKPEIVKEDVLHFPLPLYKEDNPKMMTFVKLVKQMESIVQGEWDAKNNNPLIKYDDIKSAIQEEMDRLVYELYKLDEFQISIIEEGLGRFEKNIAQNCIAEKNDYQKYSNYICDYFNYFMVNDHGIIWQSQEEIGDYFTIMRFFFDSEKYIDKTIADVLGFAGLEKVNNQLLTMRRILTFEKNGFCVIQTKDKGNWSIGKAKKMAAKMTRQILNVGGKSNDF